MGYSRAGFDVVGVDIVDQPNYPFEFHLGDALTFPLKGYDAIHASPPCQDHSGLTIYTGNRHGTGWMLAATIDRLKSHGTPWVCENVVGPDVRMDGWWFVLCGSTFGLRVRRHRRFGASFVVLVPPCQHEGRYLSVVGHPVGPNAAPGSMNDAKWRTLRQGQEAMGMDWGNVHEVAQAIPPAYTEFIGEQLLAHLEVAA